jgi:hypothetical protein
MRQRQTSTPLPSQSHHFAHARVTMDEPHFFATALTSLEDAFHCPFPSHVFDVRASLVSAISEAQADDVASLVTAMRAWQLELLKPKVTAEYYILSITVSHSKKDMQIQLEARNCVTTPLQ